MEVVICFMKRDDNGDEHEVEDFFDVDPKDEAKTVGDIRKEFALKRGLYDERFRLVAAESGEILHDTEPLKAVKQWIERQPNSESDEGSERDACALPYDGDSKGESTGSSKKPAEGEQEEEKEEDEMEEKVKVDSSQEEKSSHLRKTDMILKVIENCLEENKVQKSMNHDEIREEILTVMRMNRAETRIPMKTGRVPRARVLRLRVEDGYPVFMCTENDDVKYLACQAEDTVQRTKERFAKLYDCAVKDFRIFREGDDEEISDASQTLAEIGMDEGRSFRACRVGTKCVLTVFGFSVCLKIKVDFTKSIRALKQAVIDAAPDLKDIKFYMWYNGIRIPDEEEKSEEEQTPIGNIILGSHYLRVMIEYDPTLPIDLDKGPDMVVKRPPRDKPIVKRVRRVNDEFVVVSEGDTDNSVESEKADKKKTNPRDQKRRVRLIVNKRALKHFGMLIECHLAENMSDEEQNGVEHEAPITLEKLLPNMRLHELRKLIAAKVGKNEKWQHQVLFRNGTMLSPNDDHKTLRELDLHTKKVLYKEPSINVKVKIDEDNEVTLRLARSSTTFKRLAEMIESEKLLNVSRDEIRIMYKRFPALPSFTFSDYGIRDGDLFVLIRPLRIRAWHKCYAYDKDMYPQDSPSILREWIINETNITKDDLVITWIHGDVIRTQTHATLEMCGFGENMNEIEVFEKNDLPDRLNIPKEGDLMKQFPHFVESRENESDDDDDSAGEKPVGAVGGAVLADDDDDDEDDEDYRDQD